MNNLGVLNKTQGKNKLAEKYYYTAIDHIMYKSIIGIKTIPFFIIKSNCITD